MKYYTTAEKCIAYSKTTYVGRVKWYDDDMYLYSESTGIHAITPDDAKLDAKRLAEDRLS